MEVTNPMAGAFDHAAFDDDAFEVEFWDDKTNTTEIWVKIPPPERRITRPADET